MTRAKRTDVRKQVEKDIIEACRILSKEGVSEATLRSIDWEADQRRICITFSGKPSTAVIRQLMAVSHLRRPFTVSKNRRVGAAHNEHSISAAVCTGEGIASTIAAACRGLNARPFSFFAVLRLLVLLALAALCFAGAYLTL